MSQVLLNDRVQATESNTWFDSNSAPVIEFEVLPYIYYTGPIAEDPAGPDYL